MLHDPRSMPLSVACLPKLFSSAFIPVMSVELLLDDVELVRLSEVVTREGDSRAGVPSVP